MSSTASRQRQRQRRNARTKLWAAQKDLAERQVDLVSYERVLVDMATRQLGPFGGTLAIALVTTCRNATRDDCERLRKIVEDLELKIEAHVADPSRVRPTSDAASKEIS